MAENTRDIRRRVRSVKNIRQITRAMELVSAAKMQRAVVAVQQSRRYADLAWETLRSVTATVDVRHHPLLAVRPRRRLLLVLMTSNRGLAGGFNSRTAAATREYLTAQRLANHELVVETVAVGRKGRDELLKHGEVLAAEFERKDRAMTAADVSPLTHMVFSDYEAEKYDAVAVVYTDFVSMLRQEPRIRELLPLHVASSFQLSASSNDDQQPSSYTLVAESSDNDGPLFEPDRSAVLQHLVPRLLEVQLYHALLESVASEHASRMLAMRSASDAAADLITDLTFTMNQLRQSSITRELSEISAGRLALGV